MAQLSSEQPVNAAYTLAKERYAALGVDTDAAMEILKSIAISLHCWQGDDVGGFEDPERGLSGGIMATGNYPGKARRVDELRGDLDKAYSLIPGTHRLNLHAIYLEIGLESRARCYPAGTFRRMGGLGESQPSRAGLQPNLLLTSTGRRWFHFSPCRRRSPSVLD